MTTEIFNQGGVSMKLRYVLAVDVPVEWIRGGLDPAANEFREALQVGFRSLGYAEAIDSLDLGVEVSEFPATFCEHGKPLASSHCVHCEDDIAQRRGAR